MKTTFPPHASGVEDGAISLKVANGLVKLLNKFVIFGILDFNELHDAEREIRESDSKRRKCEDDIC